MIGASNLAVSLGVIDVWSYIQCQRNGFDGPVIGARPTERNVREFSDEQMKAGETIIGLQAGTNRCATQSGMAMGGVRHVADIKVDDLSRQGTAVIGLQASLICLHYSSVPFSCLATLGPRIGYV